MYRDTTHVKIFSKIIVLETLEVCVSHNILMALLTVKKSQSSSEMKYIDDINHK